MRFSARPNGSIKGRLLDRLGRYDEAFVIFDAGKKRLREVSSQSYLDAATLLGADSAGSTEHAYTEIIDALRQHGAQSQADIEELWRRIAFSILITNVDDHLHNHGFLHVAYGQWRLSPAFDVNHFPDRERELKTWISEDTGPEASIEALMSIAAYCKLESAAAKRILAEVERAVSTWRRVGGTFGTTQAELAQFADAFEHPQRDAARKVIQS
jgi:serine/threonine-protein kinase HipA